MLVYRDARRVTKHLSNRQHVHRYLFHVDAWNVPISQEIKCRGSLALPSVRDGSDTRFILLFYYVYTILCVLT